jgi:prepilin peptidase CpaA
VTTAAAASQTILVLTAAVLIYVALTDLKHYKIRNEFVLVLTALFFLHASFSGRWVTVHWNLGFALLLFLVMLYFYSKKMMGGGDLKLLAVALLWVGPFCALPFALFLLLFVCIHIVAVKLKLVEVQVVSGKKWIAFAPAVAAALISVFVTGCLQPV